MKLKRFKYGIVGTAGAVVVGSLALFSFPASGATAPTANPQTCTNPVTTQSGQWSSWTDPNSGAVVNNDVYNPGGTWSQTQSICSSSSWNLSASFPSDPGVVQAYPDTYWNLNGTTPVSGYSAIWQCFGATAPASGGYLDFGIDDWVGGSMPDNVNTPGSVEVMVQNKYTYAIPSGARAVTIDGYQMEEFQGGGANEWVYAITSQPDSGCVNMVDIFDDLAANPSTSGMTTSLDVGEMFYGIEMEGTNGTESYGITDATLSTTLAGSTTTTTVPPTTTPPTTPPTTTPPTTTPPTTTPPTTVPPTTVPPTTPPTTAPPVTTPPTTTPPTTTKPSPVHHHKPPRRRLFRLVRRHHHRR